MRGLIGMIETSQVLERERRVFDRNRRAVEDRDVLFCQGMAVFEPPVGNAPSCQIPAPADQLDCFKRSQVAFGEPVERKTAAAGWRYQRKLLDTKVFGLALELLGAAGSAALKTAVEYLDGLLFEPIKRSYART
jgi:hypothetical protein